MTSSLVFSSGADHAGVDGTVGNLSFPECDLDANEFGGVLTWDPPFDIVEADGKHEKCIKSKSLYHY